MIVILAIFLLFIYFVYPGPGYVFDVILSISLVLILFLVHEGLHYVKAKQLGYFPKWYRTKVKMGFEITKQTKKDQWNKDRKKIGIYPYIVLVPLSILITIIGLQFSFPGTSTLQFQDNYNQFTIHSLGIFIAGVTSLLLHVISFRSEGKEIHERKRRKRYNYKVKKKCK